MAALITAKHDDVGDPSVVFDYVIVLQSHLQATDIAARRAGRPLSPLTEVSRVGCRETHKL